MARTTSASTDATPKPKKQRWYHQVWGAYTMTREQDPAVTWLMLGVFVAFILVGVIVGQVTGHPIYWLIITIPFGLLGAMFLLTRRAERAAYTRIEGQPGASRAALGTVRGRGQWSFDDEPVAVNKSQDMVFRGYGRPGVLLVSEGPSHRVAKLIEDEKKRVARILPNVPVHAIQMGDEATQVSLPKLSKAVMKLKNTLTKPEADQVAKRLHALGGMKLAVPKGIDPTRARPNHKGPR